MFDQANDRFTYKTGYLPLDGTKPSVKDRFRMGRSGTPDPMQSLTKTPCASALRRVRPFTKERFQAHLLEHNADIPATKSAKLSSSIR